MTKTDAAPTEDDVRLPEWEEGGRAEALPLPNRKELSGIGDGTGEARHQLTESWFTDDEAYLFGEGNFLYSYRRFGAHFRRVDGVSGVQFAVWAPNAQGVSVIGPFNGWDPHAHPMHAYREGIWELFIPTTLAPGHEYKFSIQLPLVDSRIDKSDPYGFYAEVPPETASRIWPPDSYPWSDGRWVAERASRQTLTQPLNIYEVHLGSWRRAPEDNSLLGYRELAHQLVAYVQEMGYTHIELLPITEPPLRWLLGLSKHRVFRTHQPLWDAGRFQILRRLLPPERNRRHS